MSASNASQIIAKVFTETCDPIVYGYGVREEGTTKHRPHRANPLDKAPPSRDKYGKRRYATVRPADRDRHITGECPLFTAGCANRRSKVWAHAERLEELLVLAGLGDEAEQAAEWIVEHPRLLPRHLVIKAHRVHPTQHPKKAEQLRQQAQRLTPPSRQLVEYLIGLNPGAPGIDMMPAEPDWWLAHRLIEQATGWKLTPRKWAMITVDIDGDRTRAGAHAAQELAALIVLDLLAPQDIPNIVEPSRSRTGAYIRLIVALDGIDTDTFNASLDALCALLRDRYGTLAENGNAGICSVKGKLVEWRRNPAYDRDYAEQVIDITTGRTQADRYDWKRKNAGELCNGAPIEWHYIPRLEPLICAGAVDLITSPLHGLQYDRDGGQRRVADWQWLLDQREQHAPTAARLFDLLGVEPELAAKTAGPASEPANQAKPTRRGASRRKQPAAVSAHAPDITTADGQAVYGFDGWRSYLGAARIAMRRTGGDVEQAAPLARQVREEAGVCSGMTDRDRERRLKDSLRAAQYAARTYDPSRSGTGRRCDYRPNPNDVEQMLRNLPRHVPAYLIRFQNEKRPEAKLDEERLAIGLVAIEDAMHDEVGEQGAVTRNLILAALANHQGRNPHTSTAAAIVEVLQEAGLMSITRKAREGRCRMFQLARHCPLIQKVSDLPRERRIIARPRRPEPLPAPQMSPQTDNVRSDIAAHFERLTLGRGYWQAMTAHVEPARAGPGPDPPVDHIPEQRGQRRRYARSVLGPLD